MADAHPAHDAVEALRDEPLEPDVVDSDLVYEGRVWDVRSDTLSYGDGEIVRQYVDHPGAAAIVALDDEQRVLLIQQYRHPIRHRDWEIPAGLLDVEGETPLETAQRELVEEADLGPPTGSRCSASSRRRAATTRSCTSSSPGAVAGRHGARARSGGGRHPHRVDSACRMP